jgi:hypothetical protein
MTTYTRTLVAALVAALLMVGAPAVADPVTIDDVPSATGITWVEGSRSTGFRVMGVHEDGIETGFPRLRHMQYLCNVEHGQNTKDAAVCRGRWRDLYGAFVAFRDR